MSIATEISRLQSAKADIKTAIEGKGVTVPSATLLDGYATLIDSIQTGGGSPSWSSIGSNTVTPSVRNLFYALANDTVEHGEFTLASTPANTQLTLFTLQDIVVPCNNILIIDKDFYQGASGLPHQSSDAVGFLFFSKAFLNPAAEQSLGNTYPSYGYLGWSINQTITTGNRGGAANTTLFDNATVIVRGYFEWSGQSLLWRTQYGGHQYTTFIANRTYYWIAF